MSTRAPRHGRKRVMATLAAVSSACVPTAASTQPGCGAASPSCITSWTSVNSIASFERAAIGAACLRVHMVLMLDEIASRLEEYIRAQVRIAGADRRFSRSVPLFEAGYVDSVGVAELLGFITATFGVDIPDDVLTSDAFTTIDGIAAALHRLLTGSPQ